MVRTSSGSLITALPNPGLLIVLPLLADGNKPVAETNWRSLDVVQGTESYPHR
jgi:hypothetical protein